METDNQDFRPAILATNTVLIVLSCAAIVARVGRRVVLLRESSWHDALITLAAVAASTFSILQMVSTRYGVGLRQVDVPPENMKIILKLTLASRLFYFACNWAVKHSLLLFYSTLTVDRIPRLSITIMHIIAFAFGLSNIITTLLQCWPMHKIWSPNVPGHCLNINHFNYFNSCFMLATDLILYAMPLVFTWRLHVSRPQRIAVNILFMLGGLVLAASGARVYFVHAQATHPDFTYRFAMTMVCAVIENHLAIIVACAPSIKVILLLAFPSLAVKFERLVSKDGQSDVEFRESAIGTLNGNDLEGGWFGRHSGGSAKSGWGYTARPVSWRTTTDESARSNKRDSAGRKWWRAPSSWEVNRVSREGASMGEVK